MSKKKQSSTKDSGVCANCGMDSSDWSDSYQQGSETYCCQGCAEQTGCTCNVDKRATA